MRRGPIHGGIAYAEIMYCALGSRSNGVRLPGLTRRMTPGLHTTIMPLSAYSIPDGGMCGRLFIVTSGIVPLHGHGGLLMLSPRLKLLPDIVMLLQAHKITLFHSLLRLSPEASFCNRAVTSVDVMIAGLCIVLPGFMRSYISAHYALCIFSAAIVVMVICRLALIAIGFKERRSCFVCPSAAASRMKMVTSHRKPISAGGRTVC